MTDAQEGPSSRRRIFGVAAAGAAGLAAGFTGGAALGQSVRPPGPPVVEGRRRFAGKVVAITGGTSGIGRAAAIAFAAEGARVAFCGRNTERGAAVERAIGEAGGEGRFLRADVLQESQVAGFIENTLSAHGRLDVVFANAGISIEKTLHEMSAEEWNLVHDTNLRGVFLAIKHAVPPMVAGGGGHILVTSSSNAIATEARRGAYAASKRALVALVQAAALDYAEQGIRVNAILPGTTDTPLVRRLAGMENMPDALWRIGARQWARANLPGLRRLAQPEEIAAFALGLCSDEHPYLTGAALTIDGGKTAHGG